MKLKISSIFFILLLLQSCINFKPCYFDKNTKRYNNYESNYSIEILNGYNLLSSAADSEFKKTFIPNAPSNTIIFINKEKETLFAICLIGDFELNSQNEKRAMLRAINGQIDILESCKECKNTNFFQTDEDINIEFEIMNEFSDSKITMKMIPLPLSINSSHYGFYTLLGVSKEKKFEEIEEDFLKMSQTLRAPAFSEPERKTN